MSARLVPTLAAVALAGCWPLPQGFVHDETVAGPYRLVAVDSMEQMLLCRSFEGSNDCMGDGLPGETIFAAGADDRHLVLARHPREWPSPPDRRVTEYYYIVRAPDEARNGPRAVRGPFTAEQFGREKVRLHLPEFSRTFEELR